MRKDTQEAFIRKAKEKHGDKCDYSLVEYVKSNIKVKIICNKHDVYEITPNGHLSGKFTGCMKCRIENSANLHRQTKEHFTERSFKTHGDKYNYEKVKYVKVSVPVEIVCKIHGSFWQRPDHHYSGSGCSSCQNFGYRPNISGNFYIIKSGNITKVGICNRKIEQRIKGINKSSGKEFKLFFDLGFETGKIPLLVETAILKYLRNTYKSPEEIFDGSTECFYDVDMFELLNKIRELGEKYD